MFKIKDKGGHGQREGRAHCGVEWGLRGEEEAARRASRKSVFLSKIRRSVSTHTLCSI